MLNYYYYTFSHKKKQINEWLNEEGYFVTPWIAFIASLYT